MLPINDGDKKIFKFILVFFIVVLILLAIGVFMTYDDSYPALDSWPPMAQVKVF